MIAFDLTLLEYNFGQYTKETSSEWNTYFSGGSLFLALFFLNSGALLLDLMGQLAKTIIIRRIRRLGIFVRMIELMIEASHLEKEFNKVLALRKEKLSREAKEFVLFTQSVLNIR